MTAASTPGPWTASLGSVYEGSHLIARVGSGKAGTPDLARERVAANAVLIASAPTMAARIAALESERAELRGALQGLLRSFAPFAGNADLMEHTRAEREAARTALARGEGRS